jgi:hypothetical protein
VRWLLASLLASSFALADPVASLEKILVESGALAAERQDFVMHDLAGEKWHYTLADGVLELGKKIRWHTQLLGTYGEGDGNWEWSWSGRQDLPPASLVAVNRLRKLGETRHIEAFSSPRFPINPERDLKSIALAAAGAAGAKAFYIAHFDGGTMVVLIDDPAAPNLPPPDSMTVINNFMGLISAASLHDHRRAFDLYLQQRGYKTQWQAGKLLGDLPKSGIVVEFLADGRVAKAATIVRPPGK